MSPNVPPVPTRSILAFFWKHVKPYKWYYACMLFAPLFSSFYPFVSNYTVQLLIDVIQRSTSYEALLWPVGLFLACQLGLEAVWRLSNVAGWRSMPYVKRSMVMEAYDKVQRRPYRFFQDTPAGTLISKVKGIMDGFDRLWEEMHYRSFANMLKVVVSLVSLGMVSWHLTFFLFGWSILYGAVVYRLYDRLNFYVRTETEARHRLVGTISDRIMNIASLLAFGTRRREYQALGRELDKNYLPKEVQRYRYNFKVNVVMGLLYLVKFVFVVLYTIHLKLQGLISIGALAFVINIVFDISEALWLATSQLQSFTISLGELKNAFALIHVPPEALESDAGKKLVVRKGALVWDRVAFRYPNGSPVFEDFTLHVKPGEKVGLVGYSGAGKTSLIRLLLRYFRPDRGSIYIDGQDIADVSLPSLRSHVALIPQEITLFHRPLLDNLRYGRPRATQADVIQACKQAHIYDAIMALPQQFDTLVGERGGKLSGGQKQRIAIARAILQESPILILDEATSALDSYTEKQIQESLAQLMQDPTKTIIAVAHRLSTLQQMDRIIVLDQGKVVAEGTHDALLKQQDNLYKQLWDYQTTA